MFDAYYDHHWILVLELLNQKFLQWKSGGLDHIEMHEAIHETHQQTRDVHDYFTQKRNWLLRLIQFDEDWFGGWVKDNPLPSDYQLEQDNLKMNPMRYYGNSTRIG